MGMAAGQARLLSITSRISDNELRAQLINNDKMRLATKSAQVSDAYVQALNDTQMMFTNYDADNKTSYQQLTYNSLTAFNPYNNQYAISNSSGQILVSEKDAKNFQAADGDVNKFLGMYGLEETTTYFDNLSEYTFNETTALNPNDVGKVAYASGRLIEGENGTTEEEMLSTGYTPEELEAMYFGGTYTKADGTTEIYNGYYNTVASADYYNYSRALSNFNEKYDIYCATLAERMDAKLEKLETDDGKTLETIENAINKAENIDSVTKEVENLKNFITKVGIYANDNTALSELTQNLTDSLNGTTSYDLTADGSSEYLFQYNTEEKALYMTLNAVYNEESGKYEPEQNDGTPVFEYKVTWNGSTFTLTGTNTLDETEEDSEEAAASEEITLTNPTKVDGNYVFTKGTDPNSEDYIKISIPEDALDYLKGTGGTAPSKISFSQTMAVELETIKSTAQTVIDSIKQGIYSFWNPEEFTPESAEDIGWLEYQSCRSAAEELYRTIFGSNPTSDIDSLFAYLQDVDLIKQDMQTGKIDGKDIPEEKIQSFKNIFEVVTLDRVMNTYGEPKTAWIDTSNVTDSYNENGDAKAQWYTNLFTRMQKGYKVLQDGLASSPEWIKFAFESGLVTLEQVDSSYNWNSVIYSNCSDITEQTNSEAVAIAEAEYNAAMNKIENKDKMYDLELKNIDTEHNSLETEYESIKTAIDKNVERTFKIYS